MRDFTTLVVSVLVVATSVMGCKKEPTELKPAAKPQAVPVHEGTATKGAPALNPGSSAVATGTLPPGHPPIDGKTGPAAAKAPAANPAANGVSGTVKTTIEAGQYQYLEIDQGGGKLTWAAVPAAGVEKGQQVTIVNASLMKDFESPTMGKKFDEVWFGALGKAPAAGKAGADVKAVAAAVKEAAPTPTDGSVAVAAAKAHAEAAAKEEPQAVEKIEPPEGGMSVADLYAKSAELAGKEVTVRGKVVKYNGGILERNWVHLRDGSGSKENGTNDMLITTTETTGVGQIITVKGKLALEKDFGHGYKYAVLVEEGTIQK